MLNGMDKSRSKGRKDTNKEAKEKLNKILKLVISNPEPSYTQNPSISQSNPTSCFTVNLNSVGGHVYEMIIQDPSYRLYCTLFLEVENAKEDLGSGTVTCHFSTIDKEPLREFVEFDETLFGMFMIQFQMKILEQLFLFCAKHCALKLMIFMDDVQGQELNIYKDFLVYEDKIATSHGAMTEMAIPADQSTFANWIDFMKEINTEFQQTLWREQKDNLLIQQYCLANTLVVG